MCTLWKDELILKAKETFLDSSFSSDSYRVDTEAVRIFDDERVIFVCEDYDIWDRVDAQGVVICPEYRTDMQRQRSQMTLG